MAAPGQEHRDSTLTKPSKYRAPTWSCASIDGRVNTDYHVVETAFVEVLTASAAPSGLDRIREVTGGEIRLRGLV